MIDRLPPVKEVSDAWRAALWILEALPATKRSTGPHPARPLHSRKLVTLVDRLWHSGDAVGAVLREHVVSGVPFDQGIRWWAERHQVPAPSLQQSSTLISAAGGRLLAAVGTIAGAHAVLVAAAGANVVERDTSFSEKEIRTDIVRELLQSC